MKSTQTILISVLIFGLSISTNKYGLPESNGLGVLDDYSFDEFLISRNQMMVLFYSEKNATSVKALQEFSELAERITSSGEDLPVVLFNVDEESDIPERNDVKIVPSVVLFVNEKRLKFNGVIRAGALYDWGLKNILQQSNQELTTYEEIEKLSKMKFAVLIQFPRSDVSQSEAFFQTIDAEPNTAIFYTHLPLNQIEISLTSPYNMLVYRTFDDGKKIMSSLNPFTVTDLRQFINMFKNPMIYEFDKDVVDLAYTGNTTFLIYFTKEFTHQRNATFRNFAFQNRHKINIYQCSFAEFLCMNFAFSIGHSEDETESVFIVKNEGKGLQRYKFKAAFEEQPLTKFVDNFGKDLLAPFSKSEPEPDVNDGVILKVVRNTFTRKVLNSPRATVVIAYNENEEWKELESLIENFAKKYTNNVIDWVKFDASKNEHDNVYVTKLPQFFVYHKGNKNRPVVYLGKNKEKHLKKFFEEALKNYLEEKIETPEKEL